MAGQAVIPPPVCCRCSASPSPQGLALAVPKPFGPRTHQQSMSFPMPMAVAVAMAMPFSAELSSLRHGYHWRDVSWCPFILWRIWSHTSGCHVISVPNQPAGHWPRAQGAAPEPAEGCIAPVPGGSGDPAGILRTKLRSRMEGKAAHPK